MKETIPSSDPNSINTQALDTVIRIGLVMLLLVWSFNIVRPFILPVLWGAIIAVAIYPVHHKLQSLLGGREKLAATFLTLFALALVITPMVMLSDPLIKNSQALAEGLEQGTLKVPPPSDSVKGWPLVGEKLYESWVMASTNLDLVLEKFKPQLEMAAKWLLSAAAGAGGTILTVLISIVVAGAFLVYAHSGVDTVERIASRLMGKDKGDKFADLAGATIRSVAQGVLGVAFIQATLAAIGLLVVGVPYAGIWALLVLLLAVVQLPTFLVLGPIVAYVFMTSSTVVAVIFTIWMVIVSTSDTFLKPLLLGRGVNIPMLVILVGAIGGMLLSGIIGLFVGAVVLAVSYSLFIVWLDQDVEEGVNKTG